MSFGQVFLIKFVLCLPNWASGDKNLYRVAQKKPEQSIC